MTVREAVAGSYLTRGLDDAEIEALAEMSAIRRYEPGQTILRQFGRDDDLMILIEGRALVKTHNGDEIGLITPGDVFGEVALIDDMPRSADVVAELPCDVVAIPAEDLRTLMATRPEVAAVIFGHICRVLCRRLREATLQVDALLWTR
jgi:CRP-like cAMP-binding protein